MSVRYSPAGGAVPGSALVVMHWLMIGPTACRVAALLGRPYNNMPISSSSQDAAILSISSLLPV